MQNEENKKKQKKNSLKQALGQCYKSFVIIDDKS